jgi:hypothetical protein
MNIYPYHEYFPFHRPSTYAPVPFMAAPTTAAVPADRPDPHQDRQATGTDGPTSTGRLLRLVRALIDYGRQLATTLQQRTAATNLTDITRNFGTMTSGKSSRASPAACSAPPRSKPGSTGACPLGAARKPP